MTPAFLIGKIFGSSQSQGGAAQSHKAVEKPADTGRRILQYGKTGQNLSRKFKKNHNRKQYAEEVTGRSGENTEFTEANPLKKRNDILRDIVHLCFLILSKNGIQYIYVHFQVK